MEFVNNKPEQIKIRKSQNTLIVVGTGTVLFSTREILEVELCQATEEIGFREIWLGIDDHIETLDRQHIVLVV